MGLVLIVIFVLLMAGSAWIFYRNKTIPKKAQTPSKLGKLSEFRRLPLDERQVVFANLIEMEIFIQESFYGQVLQEIDQTCTLEKNAKGCWQYRPQNYVFRFGEEVYVLIKNGQVTRELSADEKDFILEKFDIEKLEDLWVWKELSGSLAKKLNYHNARFEHLVKDNNIDLDQLKSIS